MLQHLLDSKLEIFDVFQIIVRKQAPPKCSSKFQEWARRPNAARVRAEAKRRQKSAAGTETPVEDAQGQVAPLVEHAPDEVIEPLPESGAQPADAAVSDDDDEEFAGLDFEAAVWVPTVAAVDAVEMEVVEAPGQQFALRVHCAPAAPVELPMSFSGTPRWDPNRQHSVWCSCGVCLGKRLAGKLARQRKAEPDGPREVQKPTPCHEEPAQEVDLLSRLMALEEEEDGPRVRRTRLVGGPPCWPAAVRPHPPGEPLGRRPFRMKRKLPEEVDYLLVADDLAADLA